MPLILNGTTGVSGVDGSAGTPSYQGTDTNTGIFYPAADTIAFAEGGAEVMRIDSSGNVGIGTSSPGSKLDISGANAGSVLSSRLLNTSTSANSDAQQFIYVNSGTAGDAYTTWTVGGVTSWSGGVRNSDSDKWYLSPGSSLATTPAMVVDTSGNVGIGTSSPAQKLDVYLGTTGTVAQYVRNTTINGLLKIDGTTSFQVGTETNHPFLLLTSNTERMRITSGGLVGIGTTSPAATLDVGSSISRSGAASNNIYADYRITAATTGVVGSFASRIVGIGGSTYTIPDVAVYKAEALVAQTGVTITNAYGLYINNMTDPSSGGSVTNPWGIYQTASSNKNYFAGDVVIGTTTSGGKFTVSTSASGYITRLITENNNADYIAFVSGSNINGSIVRVGGSNVAYNTSSDYRLKENIVPMTGALAKIQELKPCNWTWKLDGTDGQGFIAHELQKVCPDAVSGTKDEVDEEGNPKYQGVDTSFLVATLTAAIQEQQAMIEELTNRIKKLEGAK